MVKFKLFAELYGSGIFNQFGMSMGQQTPLSEKLNGEINSWGYSYEINIPFEINRFSAEDFYSLVKKLDMGGLELLQKVKSVWKIDQETGESIEFQNPSEALGWILIDPPTEKNYLNILNEFIQTHKNEFANDDLK